MLFSFIIPVYDRPNEVDELLASLSFQTKKNYEIIIVEDGSKLPCKKILDCYKELKIKYIFQENTGPGPARNKGATHAMGEYLIFLDSDCILPENYLENVELGLNTLKLNCFGGPDNAHPSFSSLQKAINYSMTSTLTTGGIRGGKKKLDKFYPRSFNMGIEKKAFENVSGFAPLRFGEDLDLSMRINESGYSIGLIPKAFVFHKRRNTLKSFFKQIFNSGIARINLAYRHKGSLKLIHAIPSFFSLGYFLGIPLALFYPLILLAYLIPPLIFFIDAFLKTKEWHTATLAVPASHVQLFAYGLGFLKAFIQRVIFKKEEFHAFNQNFYK